MDDSGEEDSRLPVPMEGYDGSQPCEAEQPAPDQPAQDQPEQPPNNAGFLTGLLNFITELLTALVSPPPPPTPAEGNSLDNPRVARQLPPSEAPNCNRLPVLCQLPGLSGIIGGGGRPPSGGARDGAVTGLVGGLLGPALGTP
jgi:hypothetical protein